jgi:hypothetical protein
MRLNPIQKTGALGPVLKRILLLLVFSLLAEKLYFDGDFEQVIKTLEDYRKQNPDADTTARMFMYKYLGVVYSSIPEARDKGESYFFQLLRITTEVTLVDMYVSDKIKKIFEGVKQEYAERQAFLEKQQAADRMLAEDQEEKKPDEPVSEKEEKPEKKEKKSHSWIWWTAGGVAVAGAVAAFILLSSEEDGPKRVPIGDL